MQELTFTLIHEYGHLLTLNDEQVKIDAYLFHNPDDDDAYFEAEDACETYFPGEGCALRSSYLYQFYTQFWDDMYDEWLDIQFIEDDGKVVMIPLRPWELEEIVTGKHIHDR